MSFRTYTIHPSDEDAPVVLRCDDLATDVIFDALTHRDVNVLGQLSNSSNGALLGKIESDHAEISVVVKPAMYENPLVDFEWGTLAKREVAAYELSQVLGWGIVPPTVLRDVEDMQCSVQLFIPHDPRQHYFTIAPMRHAEMEKFIVFDYIANNADRKAGHVLAETPDSFDLYIAGSNPAKAVVSTDDEKLWGIDHGLTFHMDDKLRTVMWEYSEQPISEELLVDVNRALPRLEEILSPYIASHEVQACVVRTERLLMNPYHRALDPTHRAFPWPLV